MNVKTVEQQTLEWEPFMVLPRRETRNSMAFEFCRMSMS
jgi:hypothetical protein